MRILFVHAHFDDYEFTASGLFELWRQKLGDDLNARVLVCTDGRAGHHVRMPGKTTQVRMTEQRASARIGKYEFQSLYCRTVRFLVKHACLSLATSWLPCGKRSGISSPIIFSARLCLPILSQESMWTT